MSRARRTRATFIRALGLAPHVEIVRQRKEREKAERIIAEVIAVNDGKLARVIRGDFIREKENGEVYACCAVGAGLLYRGLGSGGGGALEKFARVHRVPHAYAAGVSDGFEESCGITIGYVPDEDSDDYDDYERGFAVGSAIASAVRS